MTSPARAWIFGLHPVLEALEQDPEGVRRLWIAQSRRKGLEPLLDAARASRVTVERVTDAALSEVSGGGNHQGLAAEVEAFAYADLEHLLGALPQEATALVLDGVQDPRNLGAILRTAAAFGVALVCIPERRAAGVTAAAIRASAGLARAVPVCQVTNLARTLERLKEDGFWISGAVASGGQPPWSLPLTGRIALVLGSEGEGIRPLVLAGCDLRVQIPLHTGVESLNVGAAAAALLYEAARQRAQKAS